VTDSISHLDGSCIHSFKSDMPYMENLHLARCNADAPHGGFGSLSSAPTPAQSATSTCALRATRRAAQSLPCTCCHSHSRVLSSAAFALLLSVADEFHTLRIIDSLIEDGFSCGGCLSGWSGNVQATNLTIRRCTVLRTTPDTRNDKSPRRRFPALRRLARYPWQVSCGCIESRC
jgi:hypothetical protein